jgi:sulfite reductase alpha subunit-like flavoprotein
MRQDPSSSSSSHKSKRSITIVYASQTGQAKCIAESLHDLAITHKFEPTLHSIDSHDHEFTFAALTSPLIFVCSTTGDGETPETARKAFAKLKRAPTTNHLSHLHYALLGLGDTNYSQFCNGPKLFHARFQELGATCFYGPRWADDGTGMEAEVEPFKEDVWQAIERVLEARARLEEADLDCSMSKLAIADVALGSELTLPDLIECHMSIEYVAVTSEESILDELDLIEAVYSSKSSVYKAVVSEKKKLSELESGKECYGMRFKRSGGGSGFEYEPGHAIDVIVGNWDWEVEAVLDRLGLGQFR